MKRSRTRRALALMGLVFLGIGPRAQAYVRTKTGDGKPIQWENPCITIIDNMGNLPAPLTVEVVAKASLAAAASWSRPTYSCTALKLSVDTSDQAEGHVGNDGENHLIFRKTKWCRDPSDPKSPCFDSTTLALTTVSATKDEGYIVDADVEVNAVNYKWDDLAAKSPVAGAQDLQSALTHEFGHLLGFDHNCISGTSSSGPRPTDENGLVVPACSGAPKSIQSAIMFPSVLGAAPIRRMMSSDETKAICAVYPHKAGQPYCDAPASAQVKGADGGVMTANATGPDAPGGCAFARATPGRWQGQWWPLGVLALVGVQRRRRTRR